MRYVKWIFGFSALLILAEMVYFSVVLNRPDDLITADLIVVFSGAQERVDAGVTLQMAGFAPHLVISPADQRSLSKLPAAVAPALIMENQARTTFENALFTRRIIRQHQIDSVILVTSCLHAPRAWLLQRLLLFDQNVTVHLSKVPDKKSATFWRDGKVLYNEMLKLWGSLGELAAYALRRDVPETSPKHHPVLKAMRSWLLLRV